MPGGGSKPGERRGGRQKGSVNKVTADLKDMILTSLDGAGGADYLQRQAEKSPSAYLALVGKVLPLQVNGSGAGGAILIQIVKHTEDDDAGAK